MESGYIFLEAACIHGLHVLVAHFLEAIRRPLARGKMPVIEQRLFGSGHEDGAGAVGNFVVPETARLLDVPVFERAAGVVEPGRQASLSPKAAPPLAEQAGYGPAAAGMRSAAQGQRTSWRTFPAFTADCRQSGRAPAKTSTGAAARGLLTKISRFPALRPADAARSIDRRFT